MQLRGFTPRTSAHDELSRRRSNNMKRYLFPSLILMFLASCHGGNNGGTNGNENGSSTGGGATVTNDPEQPNQTVSLTGPMTRYIGRVNPSASGGALLAWSGTGVQVTFKGSQLTLGMTQTEPTQADYVDVYIDGTTPTTTIKLDDTNTLYPVKVAEEGTHTATIIKRSGAETGEILFQGVKTDGTLNPNTATAPKHLIEFIGDNVTVGYGVDGPQGNSAACPFTGQYPTNPNFTNIDDAYPVLTAKALSAAWSVIGYSGRGVLFNTDGSQAQTLPALWTMQNPQDANAMWSFGTQADVVVINAGTSDINYWQNNPNVTPDPTAFTTAYVDFLKAIRSKYPKAPIIATLGPMLSKYSCLGGGTSTNGSCVTAAGVATQSTLSLGQTLIKGAVTAYTAATQDQNVSYFEFTGNTTDVSCDYSPDKAGHTTMSAALVTQIKSVVKW